MSNSVSRSNLLFRGIRCDAVMGSITAWAQRVWNVWDIRFLIICSLILQLILVIFGNWRRYMKNTWIGVIAWLSYLMADAVAAVAIGNLSNSATEPDATNGDKTNKALLAFWAPLLLLHLGGPDSITAYSIEDTKLWLRHFLGFLTQIILTLYVVISSWDNSALSFFIIPMFIAGAIKYAERTWVLWSANKDTQQELESFEDYASALDFTRDIPGVKSIVVAYFWLQALMPYVEDFGGSFDKSERLAEMSAQFHNATEMFELIEYMLGFLYDVLYTKTAMIHTRLGFVLRVITFTCVVACCVGFSALDKDEFLHINIVITYVLLGVAVALEFYAAAMTIYSNWGIFLLIKYYRNPYVSRIVAKLAPRTKNWTRWSNSIPQLSLIKFSLHKGKPKIWYKMLKLMKTDVKLKSYLCQSSVYNLKESKDPAKLKEVILEGVQTINDELSDFEDFTYRGELALKRHHFSDDLEWSVKRNFDQSIIAWHIATEYYCTNWIHDNDDHGRPHKASAILLSNYMMYLLISHPYLLRIRGGNVMVQRTCDHIKRIDEELTDHEGWWLWRKIRDSDYEGDANSVRQGWPVPESPLDLARIVAVKLVSEKNRDIGWKILNDVWVEMLCHAASQCSVTYHMKQLTEGGELLTHVWLLLTICGFTEKVDEAGATLRMFVPKIKPRRKQSHQLNQFKQNRRQSQNPETEICCRDSRYCLPNHSRTCILSFTSTSTRQ